jgi:quinol monooxygenase YgiN
VADSSYPARLGVSDAAGMSVVIAILKAKTGHTAEVERALLELQKHTAAEPGALDYTVHRQADGGFLVYERYADDAARDAHFAAPYLIEFLGRTGDWLVVAPQVEFGRVTAEFRR